MTKFPTLILICLLHNSLGAQDNLSASIIYNEYKIVLNEDRSFSSENFFENNRDEMGLSLKDEFHLQKRDENNNGTSHLRYKHFHKGIPILGGNYILHEKNGELTSASGYFLPNIKLSTEPFLNEMEVLEIIKQDFKFKNKKKGVWDDINLSLLKKPSLWILDRSISKVTGNNHLVYEIDVEISEPHDHQRFYVDAHMGKILFNEPLIHHHAVPGKLKTRYYGEQEVLIDSIDVNKFRLHDPTRGDEGIVVNSKLREEYHNNTSYFDFSQSELTWAETDLLYCSSRFYDLLIEEFDWKGLDNENASFKNVLQDDSPGISASWNGTLATFFNGNCDYGPLTTLEIVGHEFTHGIIDYTSNLIYKYESGAINESIADVIGKALEYNYDIDNFTWELSSNILLTDEAETFRNFKNPRSKGHPAYYGDDLWNEDADVHVNSSIGNRWFYILSEGEAGSIPSGETYQVNGMGVLEAAQFVFYINRNYLITNSDYQSYRDLSLLAANELFDDQELIDNIKEAWKAVGLNDVGNLVTDIFDLSVESSKLEACEVGDSLHLRCTVKNEGMLPYLPTMMCGVSLEKWAEFGLQVFYEVLTEELLPGDSVIVDFGMYQVQLSEDIIRINYNLLHEGGPDNNSGNDETSESILNNFNGFDDLSLQIWQDTYTNTYSCENGSMGYKFLISNESCQDITIVKPVKIIYTDLLSGEQIWEDEFEIADVMPVDSYILLERTIDVSFDEPKLLLAELIFNNDPYANNNKYEFYTNSYNSLQQGYENGFETTYDLHKDLVVEIPKNAPLGYTYTYNEERIFNWNNESWFYSTGPLFYDFSLDFPIYDCERFADFEDRSTITEIITCLDLTGVEDPQLSFDLVQFYLDPLNPSLRKCGVKLKWEGTTDGLSEFRDSVVIFDQVEAAVINNRIDLPSNFVGELRMIFHNRTGRDYLDSEFLDFDVIFMDNLKINTLVSVEEVAGENSVKIYPNPLTDRLQIESSVNMKSANIFNIEGQLISSFIITKNEIYTGDLTAGMYLVKLVDESNNSYMRKVIKI